MIKEAISVWAPLYPGHHFYVDTDYVDAACMLNRCSARNTKASVLIKSIATQAIKWNVTVEACYLPGVLNEIPDAISRLHSPGQFLRLSSLLSSLHANGHPTYNLLEHMSPLSLLFLLPQVQKLQHWWHSWIRK